MYAVFWRTYVCRKVGQSVAPKGFFAAKGFFTAPVSRPRLSFYVPAFSMFCFLFLRFRDVFLSVFQFYFEIRTLGTFFEHTLATKKGARLERTLKIFRETCLKKQLAGEEPHRGAFRLYVSSHPRVSHFSCIFWAVFLLQKSLL